MSLICVIGACHDDVTLQLETKTALADKSRYDACHARGVAANIARLLRAFDVSLRVGFVGITGVEDDYRGRKMPEFICIDAEFLRIDATKPTYTAILDQHGELLIGAADTGLYERVLADNLLPMMPEQPRTVVMMQILQLRYFLAVAQSLPNTDGVIRRWTSIERVVCSP